ncbi:MAG: UDP-N-acetylmuramoyl-tripeptide--D-alanyl-D-alanine ligase [Acidobacteriota bacterium]|nr:UDP-N-acetylmuramoyl-tripeptide--D-alanyl-D-alanine ligase [Acidobacteriota bacterium]
MATPIPRNSATFTAGEIAAATGGLLCEVEPARALAEISTDSRTVSAGGLFVAIVGEVHDAHRFAGDALARGAVNLVAGNRGVAGPRIEVADTLVALGDLARHFVDRETRSRPLPVLAIGGSAGKTTTKTLAAAAVRALFGQTLVTPGNLNNRVGVPMTLFTLTPEHRAIVLECGTSVPGEIAELGRIARPSVAVVVNVDVEHSERLGSVTAIADEEGALLLAARRVAVANGDDPLLRARRSGAGAKPLTFGRGATCDLAVAARTVDATGTSTIVLRSRGRSFAALGGSPRELRISTALLGETAALNIAAALAGALALLDRSASPEELARMSAAIAAVEAVPGRLCPRETSGILILDDSYNSNPRSVRAALSAAREVAERRGARLVIALGDMLELGAVSLAEHREMLAAADRSGADALILVGSELASAFAALAEPLQTPHRLFADSAAAAAAVAGLVQAGDLWLVKGSRGIRMERLVEVLQAAEIPPARPDSARPTSAASPQQAPSREQSAAGRPRLPRQRSKE